jgi:hypothetical protein
LRIGGLNVSLFSASRCTTAAAVVTADIVSQVCEVAI